jgi:hypothetical protein
MAYWGISTERYGGWSEEERKEELENAELPPDRELREDVEQDED